MKDQLIFDVTNAASVLDSDSVGAFVRAGDDGTLIGHVSDALKVNFSNTTIAVTDGGGSLTVDGTVAATQSGTWTVVASEDKNYGAVGATTLRTAAQIGNATGAADFGNGATGAQTLRVTLANDVAISTSDAALANTAIAHASNPLGSADTAEDVVASPLANRKYLWIYNTDNQKIFIGASGVTAATGFPISGGAYMELRAGAAVDIEFVGSTGKTPTIKTLELS